MKHIILPIFLALAVLSLHAQRVDTMYIWQNGHKSTFTEADSISFCRSTQKFDYNDLTYKIDDKTFKMVKVEGNRNLPSFYIMQTEIPPNAIFEIGDSFIGCLSEDKVVTVSDFRNFLDSLRMATDIDFRLPTEEEWVYAARGGQLSKNYTYSGSNNINDVAWYKGNSYNTVHDVALKRPNELGLYDMSGNYAEVCFNKNNELVYNIDGDCFGGSWKSESSDCFPTSSIPGTTNGKIYVENDTYAEKNAFDARYITVRLVYSAPYND